MKNNYYSLLIISALVAFACKPKFDVPNPEKGSIDPSKFVAVGSAMTAGYSDGALYYEGQQNSFASILAEQLKAVGGTDFTIPYISQNSAGVSVIPNNATNVGAKFVLGYKTDCNNASSLSPVQITSTDNFSIFSNNVYASSGPFNNMGVPGAKSFHLLYNGYGNPANASGGYYNPFYQRMCLSNTSSVLADAVNQSPTFFSMYIGVDDVLSYALAGGASDTITAQSRFDAAIDQIVNQLTQNGAKGVIGNIPDITSLPFFTTIPYNGLAIDQATANSLNNLYNPLGFDTVFKAGPNAFMIQDPQSLPLGFRQIKEGECILLSVPLDSVKCYKMGALIPIPNRHVLTATEISQIKTAITGFNIKLQAVAQAKGLAFVDVNAFMRSIKAGVIYNGVSLNAEFVKGGSVSLDGLNLNPVGNALLANEFIKSINQTYSSSILQVDAIKYRGTIFP